LRSKHRYAYIVDRKPDCSTDVKLQYGFIVAVVCAENVLILTFLPHLHFGALGRMLLFMLDIGCVAYIVSRCN